MRNPKDGQNDTHTHTYQFTERYLLGSKLSNTPNLYYVLQVFLAKPPFLEQVLNLNSFRQLGGRSEVLPESFVC